MSGESDSPEHKELVRLLEQLPEGVMVVDASGFIQFANKVGARLIKLKPKKAVGAEFPYAVEDGPMRDFDVELTCKDVTWAGSEAKLIHLKSLKSSGAFHLEWKLESALERAREAETALEELKSKDEEGGQAETSSGLDTSYYEERIQELESLLELAELRADELQNDIAVDDHQRSTELQDALSHAREAEDQLRLVEQDLADSRERIRVAEEQAEVAEERAYNLEAELEQLHGELEESNSEELTAQLQELQENLSELESELESTRRQNESLKDSLKQWEDTPIAMEQEVEESQTIINDLRDELEYVNEQSEKYQEQVAAGQRELQQLRSEIEALRGDKQEAEEEESAEVELLRTQVAELESRLEEARKAEERVAELEVGLQEKEQLAERLKLLEEELKSKEGLAEQIESLETQLEESRQVAAQVDLLQIQSEDTEKLRAQLEEAQSARAEAQASLEELTEHLSAKQDELEEHRHKVEELEEKATISAEESEELAEHLRIETEQFEAQIGELQSQIEQLSADLEAAESERDSLLQELEDAAEVSQERSAEAGELQAKVNELEEVSFECDSLKKDVRRLEKLLEDAEELAKKGEKVEKLERKLEGALRRAEEADERLEEERRLLNELKEKVSGKDGSAPDPETERLAFQDDLTGLPNRHIIHRYLGFMLNNSSRYSRLTALLRIDCDDFGALTETLGDEVGDAVLREAGERLSSVVRNSDVLGRYGEDEFIILLSDLATQEEASVVTATVIKRLYQRLSEPFMVAEQKVQLGVSVGVSLYPVDATTGEQMFEHSAVALKGAKDAGKGRAQYYTQELQDAHLARSALDAELKRGLEGGQFELLYQPIFDLSNGQIVGVESLVRWHHPTHGVLEPNSFLQVAEDSGMIVLVGNWGMRKAVENAAEWHKKGVAGTFVSINLSKRQLLQADLVPTLHTILQEYQCAPDRLLLEISESLTGSDMARIHKTLIELQHLGVKLAVDNFGSASTSLQEMRQGPFTVVKIDRDLVRGVPQYEDRNGIVLSALTVGYHLGRVVVAVGVESEAEKNWLAKNGCRFAQGNFLCPPLTAAQLDEFCRGR